MTDPTYITFREIEDTQGIPKATLQHAAKAGHLKAEWRKYPVRHQVTTQAWLDEWKQSDKSRSQRPKLGSKRGPR